jgi:DNA polymerase II small subunit/DNA polymerase delta subunit B
MNQTEKIDVLLSLLAEKMQELQGNEVLQTQVQDLNHYIQSLEAKIRGLQNDKTALLEVSKEKDAEIKTLKETTIYGDCDPNLKNEINRLRAILKDDYNCIPF